MHFRLESAGGKRAKESDRQAWRGRGMMAHRKRWMRMRDIVGREEGQIKGRHETDRQTEDNRGRV